MPLVPTVLQNDLLERWLVEDSSRFPASNVESGQRFASCVASWFTLGVALGFPCTTALARESQLAGDAANALAAGLAPAAGVQLATAVANYITGQSFGTGVAAAPVATPAVQLAFGAVFADLQASREDRAERIALGCLTLAVSTTVAFSAPPGAGPIL